MGRPAGSLNTLLTKKDRTTLLRDLKAKALSGDSSAATAVILLDQSLRQQRSIPRGSTRFDRALADAQTAITAVAQSIVNESP